MTIIVPEPTEPIPIRKLITELTEEQVATLRNLLQFCWICLKDTDLIIDSGTNGIRGVLCTPCKNGLMNFENSTDNLRKAIRYLNR